MSRPVVIPINQAAAWRARQLPDATAEHLALNAGDGTLQLLRSGFVMAGTAALALLMVLLLPGGLGLRGAAAGPASVGGWLALMVAAMSMPFGLLLLLLGGAKWLRNRHLSRIDGHSAQRPLR